LADVFLLRPKRQKQTFDGIDRHTDACSIYSASHGGFMSNNLEQFLEADALLPCPFCGEVGYRHLKHRESVCCCNDDCWIYGIYMNERAWNRRKPDLAKMVEDMRVAVETLKIYANRELFVGGYYPSGYLEAEQTLTRLKPYEKLFEKEVDGKR
jgi:hypothetical protein